MDLIEYAKSELKRAFPDETDKMQMVAIQNVMDLLDTFCKQGHSGFSGNYVLNLFERLVRWNPILPLTGEDDEWGEPYGEDNLQQNKRCGKIFRKNFDNSTAYNVEGKVFFDEDGLGYICADSRVPITFPYKVPDKPEYVKRGE